MIWIYRVLTKLLKPLITYHMGKRLKKGKEHPERIQERFGIINKPRPEGFLIWLHAASVGEALSSLPLIKRLQQDFPEACFLLTTGTISSAQIMHQHMNERCFHQFIPIDLPDAVQRFLNHWQPDLVLWIESDLWPNILDGIKKRGIKAFLINARLSDRSFKIWRYFKFFAQPLLSVFYHIYAQSVDQASRFEYLGAKRVSVLGNLKFSAPPLACNSEGLQKFRESVANRKVFLAASTHAGEEEAAIKAHLILKKYFSNILTLIAPRHPHRADSIEGLINQNGLTVTKRTNKPLPSVETDIFICDTLGEMGLFYQVAPVVFLGGSLVPIGGHNVIEPAHFDCVILHGPNGQNFQETTDRFVSAQAMIMVHSAEEIAAQYKLLIENPEIHERISKAAQQIALSHDMALETLVSDLSKEIRLHAY